jgi:hypothetical protein
MKIEVTTSYEIGQTITENSKNEKALTGKVIRIEIIILSDDYQDIDYILDNGGKIRISYKSPNV